MTKAKAESYIKSLVAASGATISFKEFDAAKAYTKDALSDGAAVEERNVLSDPEAVMWQTRFVKPAANTAPQQAVRDVSGGLTLSPRVTG